MKYTVSISKSVVKELDNIAEPYFSKLCEHIESLKSNPRPNGAERLKGLQEFKLRVGNYRIVYAIDDKKKEITIFIIDHRKQVYKRLKRQ